MMCRLLLHMHGVRCYSSGLDNMRSWLTVWHIDWKQWRAAIRDYVGRQENLLLWRVQPLVRCQILSHLLRCHQSLSLHRTRGQNGTTREHGRCIIAANQCVCGYLAINRWWNLGQFNQSNSPVIIIVPIVASFCIILSLSADLMLFRFGNDIHIYRRRSAETHVLINDFCIIPILADEWMYLKPAPTPYDRLRRDKHFVHQMDLWIVRRHILCALRFLYSNSRKYVLCVWTLISLPDNSIPSKSLYLIIKNVESKWLTALGRRTNKMCSQHESQNDCHHRVVLPLVSFPFYFSVFLKMREK